MPMADAPTALQMSAGPMPNRRIARPANSDPTSAPTPPAEMTIPSASGWRPRSSTRNRM